MVDVNFHENNRYFKAYLNRLLKYVGVGKQAAWESSLSFILKVTSTGLGFLSTVVLARLLGAQGYGVYAFAYAIATLLALPAQAGLPNLVLRETTRGISGENPGIVKGLWQWAVVVVLFVSVAIITVAAIIISHIKIASPTKMTILSALPLVPLLSLLALVGSALRGLKYVIAGQLPESIVRPILFLLFLVSSFWLFHIDLTPAIAMTLRVFAGVFALSVGLWILWNRAPTIIKKTPLTKPDKKYKWGKSALIFALIAGFSVLTNQASTVILGIYTPPSEIGVFRVAVQIASLAAFGLQAVNMVVAPRFAGIYAKGELDYLQHVVRKSAQVVLAFSLLITMFFLFLGKPMLGLVFGPAFVVGYVPLVILLMGQLVNSAAGSVGLLLNMTGHEEKTARGMAIAASVNIIINFLLVPSFGAKGAAIATAVSLVVWNIVLWIAARKNLGINSLAFNIGSVSCASKDGIR